MSTFNVKVSENIRLDGVISWTPGSNFGCHTYGMAGIHLSQLNVAFVDPIGAAKTFPGKTPLRVFCEEQGIIFERFFSSLARPDLSMHIFEHRFQDEWPKYREICTQIVDAATAAAHRDLFGENSPNFAYLFVSDHLIGGFGVGDMDTTICTRGLVLKLMQNHGVQGVAAPLVINPNHYQNPPHVDQAWILVKTMPNKPFSVAWDTCSVFNVPDTDPNTLATMKKRIATSAGKDWWKNSPGKFLKHYKDLFSWAKDE
jgi:hypothetical protein